MIHDVLSVGPLGCNCSIVGDESSREAAVIDPGGDVSDIMARVLSRGLHVTHIVVTHAHLDHIAGAFTLQRMSGAPVLYNQADLPLVGMMEMQAGWLGVEAPEVHPPDIQLAHGDSVLIGSLRATALFTPGHTPGSACLYLPAEATLLAGDTLFRGSIGRTDLPGGDLSRLLQSIREHLLPLPDETRVVPGHGAATSIGIERETNPFLQRLCAR